MLNISRRVVNIVGLAIAIPLLFTPFYSLSYLIILALSLRYLPNIFGLSTYVGRGIVASLLLGASVMIVGFITWALQIPTLPIIVAAGYFLIIYSLYSFQDNRKLQLKIPAIGKGDILALSLGLVAPIIMLVSYQLPNPSYAALYQFLNNGWDNSSHVLMLESASLENGYLYGPYEDLKEKTITKFNSYPQAWHLATAHMAGGFGFNPFDPSHQTRELATYTFVLFGWYMVAAYLFVRIAWQLLLSVKRQSLKNDIFTFVIISLTLLCVVIWGSLTTGFANYIGCIAYLMLLVAIILGQSSNPRSMYLGALIAGTASSISWFLPLPAIGLMILFAFASPTSWKHSLHLIKNIPLLIATIIAAAIALGQVVIFVVFSHVSGASQLNAGTLGGAFEVSQLFLLVVTSAALIFWTTMRLDTKEFRVKTITIITPLILLTGAVFVYQLITTGVLSYYFGKSMGLLLLIASVFFVPAFVTYLARLKDSGIPSHLLPIVSLSVVLLLLFGTNQSVEGGRQLLQSSSKTSLPVAQEIINYLSDEDPKKTKLVVLRDISRTEDYNGNLASKLPHLPMTCAYSVVNYESSFSLDLKLKNLDECATKISNTDILVLTSSKTLQQVKDIAERRNNVRFVNVP